MPTAPVSDLVTERAIDASGDLDGVRAAIISKVLAARASEHAAQLQQVWMALQWAHLHPVEVGADGVVGDYAGWGDPGLLGTGDTALVPLAGPGAPLVSALAPLALAAALGRPLDHARQLLGDALELAHRLPRLWALTQQQRVPVWLARVISRETHDLTPAAAAHADRLITAVPDKIGTLDARRLVHEARLHVDPDRARAEEDDAAARRGVWLRRDHRAPGVTDVHMTLDADDADLLDQTVSRIAADLRDLGDTTSRDVRRATAVGILADPQHALDLMTGHTTHSTNDARPGSVGGDVDLVVHLTADDLEGEHGTAVEERRGAVSTRQLATWIQRRTSHGGRVRVRAVVGEGSAIVDAGTLVRRWATRRGLDVPVVTLRPIALADDTAVDAHDPPPVMREQVVLRDAHCVFPGCRRDSRTCDLDHIEAYQPPDDGGPPGQTHPANLAPLCRRHHNAKTHHGWTYHRHPDGSYQWVSPTRHRYTVVPASRAPLNHRP